MMQENYPDSGVYKVTSYNEMKEILILLKNNSIEYSFEQRNQLRDRYLSWNSEKLSSHRVADAIKKYCIEKTVISLLYDDLKTY